MADIVERLRAGCVDHPEYGKTTTLAVQYDDMMEAADEITKLREALHAIACNTEPDAIRHRDYDHLAQNIHACARAALGEEK